MFCASCGTRALAGEAACTLCGAALTGSGAGGGGGASPGLATGWSTPASPHASVPAVQYGGFWRRFTALVIDSWVLFFPAATLRVVLGLEVLGVLDPLTPSSWTAALAEIGLGWLYAGVLISSPARGTLGQQVMDLKVTDLHGGRLSFLRASARYLAQCLSLLTLGVGYLIQVGMPRRQTLHDWVTGSLVVRAGHESRPAFVPAAGAHS